MKHTLARMASQAYVADMWTRLKQLWHKLPSPPKRTTKWGKRAFWIWIGYQAIKGTLTTSLIWIPLIVHFLRK